MASHIALRRTDAEPSRQMGESGRPTKPAIPHMDQRRGTGTRSPAQPTEPGRRRNTNSLHPTDPPHVVKLVISNPRSRANLKISSGFATSNGYPPSQSKHSQKTDMPRD